MMDYSFGCICQLFTSQDTNWWTGVVWITCRLLWCFYQLFVLSFWWHPFRKRKGHDVWRPIFRICALYLTHPSAHTQQWVVNTHTHTHTHSCTRTHTCYTAQGAVGGSVSCSRVSPQSWYWGSERWTFITPPTWDSNPWPLGYKSDSLSIRPRLP